jgi:AraC-like DNA-binding protein
MLAVNDELRADRGGDRLAIESLANLLAVHLIRNASALRPPARRTDGALPRTKLHVVIEYIDEYLDTDLTLAQLAAAVHLSAYHFARQLRAAARWPFAVVPRYQILYRQSPHSLSSHVEAMREQSLRVVERAFVSAPAHPQGLRPRTLPNLHRYLARIALTQEAGAESVEGARQSLAEALRLDPRLLLSPMTLRLCVRWALARCISPRAAERIAAVWRRGRYPHRE